MHIFKPFPSACHSCLMLWTLLQYVLSVFHLFFLVCSSCHSYSWFCLFTSSLNRSAFVATFCFQFKVPVHEFFVPGLQPQMRRKRGQKSRLSENSDTVLKAVSPTKENSRGSLPSPLKENNSTTSTTKENSSTEVDSLQKNSTSETSTGSPPINSTSENITDSPQKNSTCETISGSPPMKSNKETSFDSPLKSNSAVTSSPHLPDWA